MRPKCTSKCGSKSAATNWQHSKGLATQRAHLRVARMFGSRQTGPRTELVWAPLPVHSRQLRPRKRRSNLRRAKGNKRNSKRRQQTAFFPVQSGKKGPARLARNSSCQKLALPTGPSLTRSLSSFLFLALFGPFSLSPPNSQLPVSWFHSRSVNTTATHCLWRAPNFQLKARDCDACQASAFTLSSQNANLSKPLNWPEVAPSDVLISVWPDFWPPT